jgi:hypothetical protein
MPARKMRVELVDSDGNRYSISFEGQVTRDKAVRLLDLVELLGGMPSGTSNPGPNAPTTPSELSKYDKVRMVVQRHFPVVWFSSREVQSVYEQEIKEPIGLSTVATYLSRMTTKGVVLKAGASNSLKYRIAPRMPQPTLEQKLP